MPKQSIRKDFAEKALLRTKSLQTLCTYVATRPYTCGLILRCLFEASNMYAIVQYHMAIMHSVLNSHVCTHTSMLELKSIVDVWIQG